MRVQEKQCLRGSSFFYIFAWFSSNKNHFVSFLMFCQLCYGNIEFFCLSHTFNHIQTNLVLHRKKCKWKQVNPVSTSGNTLLSKYKYDSSNNHYQCGRFITSRQVGKALFLVYHIHDLRAHRLTLAPPCFSNIKLMWLVNIGKVHFKKNKSVRNVKCMSWLIYVIHAGKIWYK